MTGTKVVTFVSRTFAKKYELFSIKPNLKLYEETHVVQKISKAVQKLLISTIRVGPTQPLHEMSGTKSCRQTPKCFHVPTYANVTTFTQMS